LGCLSALCLSVQEMVDQGINEETICLEISELWGTSEEFIKTILETTKEQVDVA